MPERAAEVVRAMREKVAGVEAAVAAAAARRPRVFVAEWLEPPFAAGPSEPLLEPPQAERMSKRLGR